MTGVQTCALPIFSDTTAELLDQVRVTGVSPRAVAEQMARDRVGEALALRRRF